MSASPKISVIIPVYNVKPWLETCLQSVAQQSCADIEILAVDDGSTDGCGELLAQAQQTYPQLRVLTQPNQGVAAARQKGLAHATGETVCFVDGDDFLDTRYLEELWQVYCQTKAPVVMAPMVRYSPDRPEPPHVPDLFQAGCLQGPQRRRIFEDFSASMALCGKLIKRSCLEGVTFPSFQTGDDILPAVSVWAAADKVAFAPKAIYFYRERAGSQSRAGGQRFTGLLHGFSQARQVLKTKGLYPDFAPGFEYICRVCLISFMEKYGLTPQEEEALSALRREMQVPVSLFQGRPLRFRVRQYLFNFCLQRGISYARWWRSLRRLWPFKVGKEPR